MANAVGNAAKQFAPEAGMTTVAEDDETETTGRDFGNECLRSVATAIGGLHRHALLGSRGINTFPEDGLEEFLRPFFVFSGFPCSLAAGDRMFLDPEQMRFRADVLWARVLAALTGGELMITKVNSEAQVSTLLDDDRQLRLRTPLNLFIGGQILDRGITIANLIGFYYGRDPQRFQQDTVLQHSRMYGFRPQEDRAVTRFYTTRNIHRAMERMHEADSALRDRIEAQGGDQSVTFIELDLQGAIVPCSPAKILASNITTLRPHRRILPIGFQTDFKIRLLPITEAIDAKLGKLPNPGETPGPFDVPLNDASEILELLAPSFVDFEPGFEDRWDVAEYKAILRHLSESCPDYTKRGRVYLLVRTGRTLSRKQVSGQFSDSPDTAQSEGQIAKAAAQDLPVLMLFRQNGGAAQGWRDCPFWWPVIMTPANTRTTLFAHAR